MEKRKKRRKKKMVCKQNRWKGKSNDFIYRIVKCDEKCNLHCK